MSSDWDGQERRTVAQEQGQIHSAITKMEVMTARFEALDKAMNAFIVEMKEYQVKASHQARQDYEYLDTKIDRKNTEIAEVARSALKKVDEHILLSQKDADSKKQAVDWVRWLPGTVFGVIAMIIALLKFGGGQ